jgi:hypothetical protein
VTTAAKTDVASVLASIRTDAGDTLLSLAETSAVLLIFLRHFGCSFCRQAISDIAEVRAELVTRGVRPVFVHLGTPERAKPYFEYYGLHTVDRISDPAAVIYGAPAFALARMNPVWHLVSPAVWAGWLRGALFRHGIGAIREDGHQMPGLFLIRGAAIVRAFRYRSIADRPDYVRFIS